MEIVQIGMISCRSTITIFRQRTKLGCDFRIWNEQLVRYAGYEREKADGTREIIGDPSSLDFTKVFVDDFTLKQMLFYCYRSACGWDGVHQITSLEDLIFYPWCYRQMGRIQNFLLSLKN